MSRSETDDAQILRNHKIKSMENESDKEGNKYTRCTDQTVLEVWSVYTFDLVDELCLRFDFDDIPLSELGLQMLKTTNTFELTSDHHTDSVS